MTAQQNSTADGWIEWHGGECPVDKDSAIQIKVRDGHIVKWHNSKLLRWEHIGYDDDIIAYRIISKPKSPKHEATTAATYDRLYSDPQTVEMLVNELTHLKTQMQQLRAELKDECAERERLAENLRHTNVRLTQERKARQKQNERLRKSYEQRIAMLERQVEGRGKFVRGNGK